MSRKNAGCGRVIFSRAFRATKVQSTEWNSAELFLWTKVMTTVLQQSGIFFRARIYQTPQ